LLEPISTPAHLHGLSEVVGGSGHGGLAQRHLGRVVLVVAFGNVHIHAETHGLVAEDGATEFLDGVGEDPGRLHLLHD
jgi:hypothetical protein